MDLSGSCSNEKFNNIGPGGVIELNAKCKTWTNSRLARMRLDTYKTLQLYSLKRQFVFIGP